MNDMERSIDAMNREPWKYWDRRVLEEIAWQLMHARKRVESMNYQTDSRLTLLQEHERNTARALTELLAVIGFSTVVSHPTTQPVGMGEESAP